MKARTPFPFVDELQRHFSQYTISVCSYLGEPDKTNRKWVDEILDEKRVMPAERYKHYRMRICVEFWPTSEDAIQKALDTQAFRRGIVNCQFSWLDICAYYRYNPSAQRILRNTIEYIRVRNVTPLEMYADV